MSFKAWIMDEVEGDQRLPHNSGKAVNEADVAKIGVFYRHIPVVEGANPKLEAVAEERGYRNRDCITCSPEKLPNYEEKLKTFYEEHLHEDEEVRYVLEGSGYFDVRNLENKWVRIAVKSGDLLVLPAGIYHRFTLDVNDYIKATRLFKDAPKWIAINRPAPANPYRAEYIKSVDADAVQAGDEDDLAVAKFQEYLRIKTVEPDADYAGCTKFLKGYADELGLGFQKFEFIKDKDVVLMKWEGRDQSLQSIVLNSHTDVVPVIPEKWTKPAWEGYRAQNGNIYGRGTQDMKCVTIQYLEAVRRLKKSGFAPLRTIYLLMVPDEERGGVLGMREFIKSQHFKDLNAALFLDEGLANPSDAYTVFYGERSPWWLKVRATGPTGHGSRFVKDTALEKLMRVINRLLEYRAQQEKLYEEGCCVGKTLGDVTTVNLTALKAGVSVDGGQTFQLNVIPTEAECGFDIRVCPRIDEDEFARQLTGWITCEEGLSYEWVNESGPDNKSQLTSLDEKENVWWKVFKGTCDGMRAKLRTEIFPAATDSRFIRSLGIPAFGFSPMNNTPILLHDHDEFLNDKVFAKGVQVYEKLIPDLANVAKF